VPEPWTPERLALLRERLRFTQADLCRRIGVSPNAVSRWANGKSQPRGKLARALDALDSPAPDTGPGSPLWTAAGELATAAVAFALAFRAALHGASQPTEKP
jgi:transcriptional regulator with XRE-family HTH domain